MHYTGDLGEFVFIFVNKNYTPMKDRLQQLLADKALTANKLAEMLEVQPSGISHILAGRNKPSIDFVTKLLTVFPDINPDWFILGAAPMYRSAIKRNAEAVQLTEKKTVNLDSQAIGTPNTATAVLPEPAASATASAASVTDQQPTLDFDIPAPVSHPQAQTTNVHSQSAATIPNLPAADATQRADTTLPGNSQKRIRKVMIFYADHTVESFDYYADPD